MAFKTRRVSGADLRDEARDANFRVSLDGSPEFAAECIARKTTSRKCGA
jgi:hypothetical protein